MTRSLRHDLAPNSITDALRFLLVIQFEADFQSDLELANLSVFNRLPHRRSRFDEVAAMSVAGVNKSSMARVHQMAWNTVDRWLEKAAAACRRFNHQTIQKITIRELPADEIRTRVGGKEHPPVWIFAAIEGWLRLWPSTVVGRRSYRNTLSLFQDVLPRVTTARIPLNATDGFKFYRQVVK